MKSSAIGVTPPFVKNRTLSRKLRGELVLYPVDCTDAGQVLVPIKVVPEAALQD
jgi:hypothetical protein